MQGADDSAWLVYSKFQLSSSKKKKKKLVRVDLDICLQSHPLCYHFLSQIKLESNQNLHLIFKYNY